LTLWYLGLTFDAVMPSAGENDDPPLPPSIFLSYASEDRSAASSIRDAMTAAGLVVWYDENELGGGDAWDKKIRRQIRECDFFMAVISAQTEARHEGYFRREWRLAVERALDMADDHTFLLPVVIDGTDQSTARVPERFLDVQWLKVPKGQPNTALAALCNRLISGSPLGNSEPRRAPSRPSGGRAARPPRGMPAFPTEEPGQRVKFWVHVAGWAVVSTWVGFNRLPRWVRLIAYVWLSLFVLSRGCSSERSTRGALSHETAQKLNAIAEKYKGSSSREDVAKLGIEIAREFADDEDGNSNGTKDYLVEPFMDPADNPAEASLANTTFVLLYGHLVISHQGQVGLGKEPLPSLDAGRAAELGRASHSKYVIVGGVGNSGGSRALNVEIIKVSDGSVLWNKGFPVANADPATIAQVIETKLPSLDDD
jgi:TIR domain-containing protein